MPRGYQKLKPLPDDPKGQIAFATQTSQCMAFVILRPLSAGHFIMDPARPGDAIEGIRSCLSENQGIIEVEPFTTPSGAQGIYSIVKSLMDPASIQYSLTLHPIGATGPIAVEGFFEEQGTSGMRDAAGLELARRSGLVSDGLAGWMQDPYDPEFAFGALKNRSERRELDARFPEHPLSVCRSLVAHVIAHA